MPRSRAMVSRLVQAPKMVLVFLLIGIFVMAGSAGLLVWQWHCTAGLSHVDGRVAYYRNQCPIIQYEVAGETYETPGPSSSKHAPRVGDRFTVYFPEDDRSKARLTCVLLQWIFPCIFGFVGFRFAQAAAMEIWPGLRFSRGRSPRQRFGIIGRLREKWRLVFPRESTGARRV